VHRPAVERVRMAHHRGIAWFSPRVPFKHCFEWPLDPGDEETFDFRNSPPLAKLLVRPDGEARLVPARNGNDCLHRPARKINFPQMTRIRWSAVILIG
jgi:hypothetical protein